MANDSTDEIISGATELAGWIGRVAKKYKLADASPPVLQKLVEDLEGDDFWKDLEGRTVEGLNNWLNNTYGKAVETFSDDLSKSSGTSTLEVVWALTKTALSLVPQAKLALTAASFAVSVGDALPSETQSLEDFLYEARGVRERMGKSIFARTHPAIKQLRELAAKAKAEGKDDAAFRRTADESMSKVIAGLPSDKVILKGMIGDWVKATPEDDGWYDGDGPGGDAGYIMLNVEYIEATGAWKTTMGPYIDDLRKAGGARKALDHSYGTSYALRKLPFEAKADVKVLFDATNLERLENVLSGTPVVGSYRFRKSGAGDFTKYDVIMGPDLSKAKGAPPLDEIMAKFNKYYATLTVKDLISEPGW